jgi:hypothetical protein
MYCKFSYEKLPVEMHMFSDQKIGIEKDYKLLCIKRFYLLRPGCSYQKGRHFKIKKDAA